MVHEHINTDKQGKRIRQRIRGTFSGKTGKAVGIGSLAAPVLSWIVYDLRKPDSVIRTVLSHTIKRLLETPAKTQKALDITSQVEVIEDKQNKQ